MTRLASNRVSTAAIVLVSAVAICGTSAPAWADGWTQAQDDFYLKVWNRTLIGRNVFTDIGETVELPETYQDHQLNVYGEYGLTDDLTVTLFTTPVGFAAYDDENQVYFGGGTAGVRYQIYRGDWVAAVAADVGGRPSGGSALFAGEVEDETVFIDPVIGTAHGTASVQAGYGFSGGWLSGSAGARAFTNSDLDPALFANAQGGWQPGGGFILDLHLAWYHSLGSVRPINAFGSGQTKYLGVGIGASYWFSEHAAVTLGVDGAFFAAANAATPSLIAGVEFK